MTGLTAFVAFGQRSWASLPCVDGGFVGLRDGLGLPRVHVEQQGVLSHGLALLCVKPVASAWARGRRALPGGAVAVDVHGFRNSARVWMFSRKQPPRAVVLVWELLSRMPRDFTQ